MNRILVTSLKFGISFAILAYLFYQAAQDDAFEQLVTGPKQWGLLLAAAGLVFTAITITFVRWYLLVRALAMPFTIGEALRIGFICYLFMLLSIGVVGGDVLKSIFIARRQPGKKTEAIATVVFDRIVGLYALFVVASLAILWVDLTALDVRDPRLLLTLTAVCNVTLVVTAVATGLLVLMFVPGFTTGPLAEALARIPKVGPTLQRLIQAARIYRSRPLLMAVIGVMSLAVHALMTLGVYFLSQGLPGEGPPLAAHFVVVPMAILVSTVPLPAGGLGAFELALDTLYRAISSAAVAAKRGFVVALAFRLCMLATASVGVVLYLMGRRDVNQLREAAEASAGNDEDAGLSARIHPGRVASEAES